MAHCTTTLVLMVWLTSLYLTAGSASAKEVTLCNVSPFQVDISVGYVNGVGSRGKDNVTTEGWFSQTPGQCTSWFTNADNFYYYAESREALAQWTSAGDGVFWRGGFTQFSNNFCVDPRNAYKLNGRANCSKSYTFNRVRAPTEHTKLNLRHQYHPNASLEGVSELRRQLVGRMNYEALLVNNDTREAPFQIGVGIEKGYVGGVKVSKVFEGMPSEIESIQVGDVITELGGYKLNNSRDLVWVLDQLSIFNSDPLPIKVVTEDQQILNGTIEPLFYPFNHQDFYSNGGSVGAFLGSAIDTFLFGQSSEIACGLGYASAEGLRTILDDEAFDTKEVVNGASVCSNDIDLELQKSALLHKDATVAGMWAAIIVPSAAALKGAGALRGTRFNKIPLAGRSRFVGPKYSRRTLQRNH